ncbi:MAG: YdcF family protein [Oscillospiraceae bacterium]|nr:YdcF family protein [Oscillospiraceae bacterium]
MDYKSYRGNSPQRKKRHWLAALLVLFAAGVLAFGALELVIWRGAQGRTAQAGDGPEVMVIFGCQMRRDGPSILLRDRLDTALAYWEEHPDIKIVVTGGKGDDEHVSEAQGMYDYLTAHGVSDAKILMEDQSRNTHQNIRNTLELLDGGPFWDSIVTPGQCRYVLVSSDFHLARILMLWGRTAGTTANVSTLPAPVSHAPSRVQMTFREPLALVKSFLFDR